MCKCKILILFFGLCSFLTLPGQAPIKVGEAFDFDIGDEFHYHEYSSFGGTVLRKINSNLEQIVIGKTLDTSTKTVTYHINVHRNTNSVVDDGVVVKSTLDTTYIDTISYTDIDSSVFYNLSKDSLGILEFENAYHGFDSNFCLVQFSHYYYSLDGSYRTETARFGKGIGYIYKSDGWEASGDMNVSWRRLKYYKKKDDSCGTRLYLTIPDLSAVLPTKIKVYPNPAKDVISINLVGNFQLECYDSVGRNVFSKNISEAENMKIELPKALHKGIYLLLVKSDKGINTQRLVVE